MKKIVLFLTLGSVLAGVAVLAGLIYLFGAISQTAMSDPRNGIIKSDAGQTVQFVDGGYERGFLSSRGTTLVGLRADDADGDGQPDHPVGLSHEIFHGPLAMTPDGPVPCANFFLTTIELETLPEEVRGEIVKVFGDRTPVTIKTTAGFDGSLVSDIEVAPVQMQSEEGPGKFTFDGVTARITLKGDADRLAQASGTAKIGGWKAESPEGNATGEPGEAHVDFRDESALKGEVKLGNILWEAKTGSGRMEGAGMSMDLNRHGVSEPIFLGNARFKMAKIGMSMPGAGEILVNDVAIVSESGEAGGMMHTSVSYGLGKVEVPAELAGPVAPFLPLFEGGGTFQIGAKGLHLESLEKAMVKAKEMQQSQMQMLSQPGANPAMMTTNQQEAAMQYVAEILNLVRPGVEIFVKQEIAGRSAKSLAEVKLGMIGSRPLTQLKSLREVIAAIAGEATVTIPKADLTGEQAAGLVSGLTEAGFFVDGPAAVSGKAFLKNGAIEINGQPTPFIESLGPMLDDPIPWEFLTAPGGL